MSVLAVPSAYRHFCLERSGYQWKRSVTHSLAADVLSMLAALWHYARIVAR